MAAGPVLLMRKIDADLQEDWISGELSDDVLTIDRLTEQQLLTGSVGCCGGPTREERDRLAGYLAEADVMKPEQYRRGKGCSSVAVDGDGAEERNGMKLWVL